MKKGRMKGEDFSSFRGAFYEHFGAIYEPMAPVWKRES